MTKAWASDIRVVVCSNNPEITEFVTAGNKLTVRYVHKNKVSKTQEEILSEGLLTGALKEEFIGELYLTYDIINPKIMYGMAVGDKKTNRIDTIYVAVQTEEGKNVLFYKTEKDGIVEMGSEKACEPQPEADPQWVRKTYS